MNTMVDWDAIDNSIAQAFDNGYKKGKADAMTWVSVEERLPEKALPEALPQFPYSNWMLICSNANGRKGIEFARYHVDEKEWHDDFGEVVPGVTHWMPLPAPPMEGE